MQHKRYGYGLAAVAAAALLISACSGATTESTASSTAGTVAVTSETADITHNDADIAFTQGMIPHHQQAIEMSDMLLAKPDIDPAIVSLANEIKNAQGPEIEQMQGWLRDWGAGAAPTDMSGHDMPGHQMGGGSEMPGMPAGHGMMSDADMTALQNAEGTEAGRLFLTQMIQHHEGAITMAQQELDNGQFPAATELARDIVTAQQAEITTMQQLLQN